MNEITMPCYYDCKIKRIVLALSCKCSTFYRIVILSLNVTCWIVHVFVIISFTVYKCVYLYIIVRYIGFILYRNVVCL